MTPHQWRLFLCYNYFCYGEKMELFILILQYIGLALVVVVAAQVEGNIVDELDKRTNLSAALLGGVLLAAITSIPEFITSITATVVLDQPGLAFGNIFGSNFFNLVILAVMDIIFVRKVVYNQLQSMTKAINFVNTTYFIILLPFVLGIFASANAFGGLANNQLFRIVLNSSIVGLSIMSIAILVIYFLSVRSLSAPDEEEEVQEEASRFSKFSIPQLGGLFVVFSIALIAGAYFLTGVTNNIAISTGLNASFVGALFLGVATSLPELASVYTLFKLGNYEAAAGGIIGSNMFNFTIIAVVDIFVTTNIITLITDDPLVSTNALTLLVLGLINSIILLLALQRKVRKSTSIFYSVPSILIISNYLLYLVLSFV
jgi:cation:H+ antiporter